MRFPNQHWRPEFEAELSILSLEIPDGTTSYKTSCPKCGRARSFGITKQGPVLLYFCHRASCHCSGVYRHTSDGSPAPVRRDFVPRVYSYPTTQLDQGTYALLLDKYGIEPSTVHRLGWKLSADKARLVMPVLSPTMGCRGHVAKALNGQTGYRSIQYKEQDGVFASWNHGRNGQAGSYAVLVEDQLSCARVYQSGSTSVALLGTNLSQDTVTEIFQHVKLGVLCLDRDATNRSFDYARRYRLLGNFCVVPLSKDIKDMSEKELQEWNAKIQTAVQLHAGPVA